MRVIEIARHGAPEVLRIVERPTPTPGEGEVRVAVRAAGVNFADVLARLGVYAAAPPPPFVPGIELAGVVAETGPSVDDVRVGDRVLGFSPFGAYAEQVVSPARFLTPMPPKMDFREAAALPVQYLTAWYAIAYLGRLEAGETVLIPAAAGGVGRAAVELAKLAGARIVALVGHESKIEVVREIAPEAAIVVTRDGGLGETPKGRFDVVVDGVGGKTFRGAWRRLESGGRYVLFGAATAVTPGALSRLVAIWRLAPMAFVRTLPMITANKSLHAFNLFFLADRRNELLRRAMQDLLASWSRGEIRPRIGLERDLGEAAAVHRLMQDRKTVGKLVLRVDP